MNELERALIRTAIDWGQRQPDQARAAAVVRQLLRAMWPRVRL